MVQPRFRRRYAWLLALILVMTVVALLAGLAALRYVESNLIAAKGEALAVVASDVADKLSRTLFERQGDLHVLAQTPVLKRGDAEAIGAHLATLRKAYPVYAWLGLLDATGRVVVATEPADTGRDRSGEPWIQAMLAGSAESFRDAEPSQETGEELAVGFAVLLGEVAGERRGVVMTRVNLRAFEEIFGTTIQALAVPRGQRASVEWTLLSRDGLVLIDSSLRQEGQANLKRLGVVSALVPANGAGYVEELHQRRQVPVVTGYASVKSLGSFTSPGWRVLVRMERPQILAPIRATLLNLGFVAFAIWGPMFLVLLWSVWHLRGEWARAMEAESAIRASEQRIRSIVETALDAVVVIGENGRIVEWNAQAETIFGWARREVLGRLLSQTIIPPQHQEAHERGLQRFLAAGEGPILNKRIEMTACHKDGHEFPVELTISPSRGEDGWLFSAFVRDIAERKRLDNRQAVQLAISQTLTEASTLVEAAPRLLQAVCDTMQWEFGAIWLVDRQLEVLRCEALWHQPSLVVPDFLETCRTLTFTTGVGLPGRVWSSGQPAWLSDVLKDTNFPRAQAAAKADLHAAFGFPITSGSDVEGVIEFFSRNIRQPDQDLLCMMADVGLRIGHFLERWRTEQALHESERKFRLIMDHANDALLYLDADGLVLWANRRAETLSGWPIRELVGRPLTEILAPASRTLVEQRLAAVRRKEPVAAMVELEVIRPDGSSVTLEANAASVRDGERTVGRLLVVRDLGERRQVEHHLRQAEKLAALGTLLGGIAHEINNPLFVMTGCAQLAAEKLKQGHADGLGEDLRQIREAAQRARTIVERFLLIARESSGNRVPCQVNTLIGQALDLVANDCAIHQIVVRRHLSAGLPTVLANGNDLTQVFLNLVTNAEQAMVAAHGKGTLTVTTASVDAQGGRWVEVRVADDGPGITPEHQARIFEPFFTTKPVGQGTGLGLAICHRTVTELGGTLRVDSTAGQGAAFIIRLPAQQRAAAVAAVPGASRA